MYRVEHCSGNIHRTELSAPAFANRGQQQYIFITVLRIAGIGLLPSALADKHFFFKFIIFTFEGAAATEIRTAFKGWKKHPKIWLLVCANTAVLL